MAGTNGGNASGRPSLLGRLFGRSGGRRDHRGELLAQLPKGARGAEIGVWRGEFSRRILEIARPAMLHLVDPWAFQPQFPDRLYGGKVAAGQSSMDDIFADVVAAYGERPDVRIHRSTSADFFATLGETLDWVYIDGDHSTRAVLEDLDGSWAHVRSGGIICGDDFQWRDADGSLAVKIAVDQFCNEQGCACVLIGKQFLITRP